MPTYVPDISDDSNVSEYEEVANSNSNNSPSEEENFVDPGHNTADRCTCFEKKMCCLINKSDLG